MARPRKVLSAFGGHIGVPIKNRAPGLFSYLRDIVKQVSDNHSGATFGFDEHVLMSWGVPIHGEVDIPGAIVSAPSTSFKAPRSLRGFRESYRTQDLSWLPGCDDPSRSLLPSASHLGKLVLVFRLYN
ncbi:MAG: hypothetical protein Ct9H300mP19_09800 [Dehalococcoidia bacterium]|nr:MAG: hypothetical protein Ct9H300mP19_09800 [Dehalococcoidia bacterium]